MASHRNLLATFGVAVCTVGMAVGCSPLSETPEATSASAQLVVTGDLTKEPTNEPTNEPQLQLSIEPVEESYTVVGELGFDISGNKPILSDATSAADVAVFNDAVDAEIAWMREYVQGDLEWIEPDSEEYEWTKQWGRGSLTFDTETADIYQGRYASAALYFWYRPLGANGNCHGYYATFTFDSVTGELVELDSFVNTSSSQLTKDMQTEAIENYPDIAEVPEYSDPEIEALSSAIYGERSYDSLFDTWTISDEGVTFWSAPVTAVSPNCVAGPRHITIPWESFKDPGYFL